jgi:Skp family chaperone for outer membrane proteins
MTRALKTASLTAGLTLALAIISTAPSLAQLKIAFVRPEYILSQYEPYREAMKQVQTYEKTETDKLNKMVADLQKKYEDAQKQAPLMTEEKRNEKVAELEKQRADIEKAQDDLLNRESGRLFKKHEELVQPIFDRLNRVLERLGQSEKYDFIFNVTTDTQNILYADKKFDISEQVAELLKKEPVTAPEINKDAWYKGGNLHNKSALDWQKASYNNKLATCADFISQAVNKGILKDSISTNLDSPQKIRPFAEQLVDCIDAATKKDKDPSLNNKMYANQRVAEIATMCMVTMKWTKSP